MTVVIVVQMACSSSAPRQADATKAAGETGALATKDAAALSGEVTGRTTPGALVSLEPAAGPPPVPAGPVIMDQFAKAFVPETLFVRAGQPVTFKNSDDQQHNITVVRGRTGTRVLDISQGEGDTHNHTFDQPGEYDVTCDVHPGMRATIVAATTPYSVYADASGSFAFASVPPGEYRLRVSADGRDREQAVSVTGARVVIDASR